MRGLDGNEGNPDTRDQGRASVCAPWERKWMHKLMLLPLLPYKRLHAPRPSLPTPSSLTLHSPPPPSMHPRASPLLTIPPEILERIALHLALLHPLGPPVDLIALLCTCKHVHNTLAFHRSNDLYAKIFRGMFDVDAARRRLSRRTLQSRFLASQLKTYCIALQRIRRGDIFAQDVESLLRTAFILLTENDGKNRAQLEWANTYTFVNSFVRHRLWQDCVNGWPRDTPLHALVLWVMWCMTDGSAPPSFLSFFSSHLLISL